jgi:hypothetical protein
MGGERSERRRRAFGRYVKRSAWLLGMFLMGGTLLTREPRAADMPDDGLLEFLGSVDSEDKNWNEYLARTDIDKVARRAGNGSGNPQPADPPPADPPPGGADKPVTPP